jgi:hypothetical protein
MTLGGDWCQMVVYGDANLRLGNASATCAMKTCYQTRPSGVDGYFYVPNATTNFLRVEKLFNDPFIVGDQTHGASPYPEIANYPDSSVDKCDIRFVAKLFGKNEGNPGWDYMADIVPDKSIDMKDIRTAAKNFGNVSQYFNPPTIFPGSWRLHSTRHRALKQNCLTLMVSRLSRKAPQASTSRKTASE